MSNTVEKLKENLYTDLMNIMVIDTHEHSHIRYAGSEYLENDPIIFLFRHYLNLDIESSRILNSEEYHLLFDTSKSLSNRWRVCEKVWNSVSYTAYAKVVKYVLQDLCDTDILSLDVLEIVKQYFKTRFPEKSVNHLKKNGIICSISDYLFPRKNQRPFCYYENGPLTEFLLDNKEPDDFFKPVFNLQFFHELRHSEFITFVENLAQTHITSLQDYEDAVLIVLKQAISMGIIGIKDQSAYRRTLNYSISSRAEAEQLFNLLLSDPKNQLAWPQAKPLDDYLFHKFMKFADELRLPIQIHTGHIAKIGNRINRANVEHFTSVLELHKSVNFDLFHGNWPYMGDLLFIMKNYPNVHMNLCWVHMIDPIYSIELIKRAVKTIPTNKIHAFGGDFWDAPEFTLAHLRLAKENYSSALASLIYEGWINYEEALNFAKHNFYENPRVFYHL